MSFTSLIRNKEEHLESQQLQERGSVPSRSGGTEVHTSSGFREGLEGGPRASECRKVTKRPGSLWLTSPLTPPVDLMTKTPKLQRAVSIPGHVTRSN